MENTEVRKFVDEVLKNMPDDWLNLTTHRLDIYDESAAKTKFLEGVDALFQKGAPTPAALSELPTAYDYIRLGHPLSCLLEWTIARTSALEPHQVISFSSSTMPILAVLRKNLLDGKSTKIFYTDRLPEGFDEDRLRTLYGYGFELEKVESPAAIPDFAGTTIFVSHEANLGGVDPRQSVDFFVGVHRQLGSVLVANADNRDAYISEIQHVRRRESIAMTPANCLAALSGPPSVDPESDAADNKANVLRLIRDITAADGDALLASSGLSMQYAIMMGIVEDAQSSDRPRPVKIVIPPNCYGGTNDQARRVAACIDDVEVVDLLVDGDHDMVQSLDSILTRIANEDAIAYIVAEIPTNPRVEVPDLAKLKDVLSAERKTAAGDVAVAPVFILDQTFCPNVHFLGEGDVLSTVRSVSYVSGSKFPSGGLCTAGYCVGNQKAQALMRTIGEHLRLCDNEATDFQVRVLAEQMPSMNARIQAAYDNTRAFVDHIQQTLPGAKINFVSHELASAGFTPSVFSLELPAVGATDDEKEAHRRELNLKLINLMIAEVPGESKFCVSYGQLKGCYWTVPATSTQGTTQESDKDYIVRVSVSPDLDLEKHKAVFSKFVAAL